MPPFVQLNTRLVVAYTQSDSIQCLNFDKEWFIQYSFTQDSIQKIIQINSQEIIDTCRKGKVPKIVQKVSKVDKIGFIQFIQLENQGFEDH